MRFFREILIASLMCVAALIATPVAAQTTYRIQIPAFEKAALHADTQFVRPPIEPRATLSSLPYAQWVIEPVAGTPYHRIAQSTRPDWYLHNENKTLMVGPIQPGWWSAQWLIDNAPGSTNIWRICNRWTFECLTHGETSGVFLTKSLAGHAPSNWTIPGFKGNQIAAAAPMPKPTTTPVTRIGAGTPPVATPVGEPCGPAVICHIQITGLYVNKRSEISDDEIVVTTSKGGMANRYPEVKKSSPGKSTVTFISPEEKNVYTTIFPYMAMNETKDGYRTWNICAYSKLDNFLVLHVMERDQNAADVSDNFLGGDDEIGSAVFMNMTERTGNFTKSFTGDGSRYVLMYSVAARKEDLPACGATSEIRDPDSAIWTRRPSKPSYCEGVVQDAMGAPESTHTAIVFLTAVSVCEIDQAAKGA